jgi:hypothetical protein
MTSKEIDYKSKSLVVYKDGTSVSLKRGASLPETDAVDSHRHQRRGEGILGSNRVIDYRQQQQSMQMTLNFNTPNFNTPTEMIANSKTRLDFRFILLNIKTRLRDLDDEFWSVESCQSQ